MIKGALDIGLHTPAAIVALAWSAAIAAAVVVAPSMPVVGVVALGLVVPALILALVLRPAVIAIALAATLAGVARAELPVIDPHTADRAQAVAGHSAVIRGLVTDDSRPAGGGAEVLVVPAVIEVDGRYLTDLGNLLVRWRGPITVAYGDQVQATGRLMLPRDLPTFDRRAYLAQRQAYLELQALSIDVTGRQDGLLRLAAAIRAWYTGAVDRVLPPPHASVLLGVVLGVRPGIPPDLQKALVATGLVHLLVLSGLKVAVFARIAQAALRPLLGHHAAWPAIGLICVYALAGGATPAAVRATAMGALAIAATRLGRPSHVWTSLAITAGAMLGWRPELAWDVGFQLSFAGTAAIILLTPGIEARLHWLPGVVREPFAVTCAAQIGTLPMMATDFHLVSPVGPLANALVLPVLPAMVAAGLLLGPLSLVPDVAAAAAIPVAGLLAYLEQLAYFLARMPGAAINIPRFPTWTGVAYYSAVGPGIAALRGHGRQRRIALMAGVVAPIVISLGAMVAWAGEPAQASVLAVGSGQAVLLHGPRGSILIDAGPSPAALGDGLGQLLPPWERRLEAIVITAPTQGHVGGFSGFDRSSRMVVLPDVELSGSVWRTTALNEAEHGAGILRVLAGSVLEIAGFRIEVVAPEAGAPGDVPGAGDLGLRAVAADGRTFCDLSDLDVDAQTVAAARLRGPCTYLLLPSGGSSALSPELQRAAGNPELIASRGPGRTAAGFPPTLLRTDQEGTISVPL
ncbi:MAG TPA: ComEC/Rec2 family competence protein [Candidatus Dormibacteraeota bacterium]|nr:ComEC/Rec2 family competence protein [Candidatus Dormibacteraeota bacterium]